MFGKMVRGLALGTLVLASPLSAQDDGAPNGETQNAAILDALGSMFGKAEPLAPDQEARLPTAQLTVGKIFPEGTYAKMMRETMRPMMDGMMGSMLQMPAVELAKLTGLSSDELGDGDEEKISQAIQIMDPAYEERSKAMLEASFAMAGDLMNRIEPSYRAGLAKAYAIRFSEDDLLALNEFFSTPVGAHYASESMLIYADPQVMAAMNEMFPALMEMMPQMLGNMEQATSQLPKARTFSELSDMEEGKLAMILGVSREELLANEPSAEAPDETAEDAEEE